MNSAPRFQEGGAAPPVFFRAAAGVRPLVPSRFIRGEGANTSRRFLHGIKEHRESGLFADFGGFAARPACQRLIMQPGTSDRLDRFAVMLPNKTGGRLSPCPLSLRFAPACLPLLIRLQPERPSERALGASNRFFRLALVLSESFGGGEYGYKIRVFGFDFVDLLAPFFQVFPP